MLRWSWVWLLSEVQGKAWEPQHIICAKVEYLLFRISVLSAVQISSGESSMCAEVLCTWSHVLQASQTNHVLVDRPYIAWIDGLFITRAMSPDCGVGTMAICQESQHIAEIGKQLITTKSSSMVFKAVTLAEVFAYCCSQVSEWKQNEILHFFGFLYHLLLFAHQN